MKKILFLILLIAVAGFALAIVFLHKTKYAGAITITASFMQYACGDCTLDMQVNEISNEQLKFILGKDIVPVPRNGNNDSFCNYVMDTYYEAHAEGRIEGFQLKGQLHKFNKIILFMDCSDSRCFTVDSIKYGNEKWVSFK